MKSKKVLSLIVVGLIIGVSYLLGVTFELPENNRIFENAQISAEIPDGWDMARSYDDEIIIEIFNENGIANMSIDNSPYFIGASNAQTIEEFTAEELLNIRFDSILETTIEYPDMGWTNFEVNEPISSIELNGLSAAEGSFTVYENILGEGEIVNRKIKRIIVVTNNDILNIVFASTNADTFDSEEKDFQKFLDSLIIK